MTTGTLELARDLSDPDPPAPGRATHAAVHARATQIRRRHRATAALATVACAALLAVGVVAVVGTGTPTRGHVETAAAPSTPTVAAPTVGAAAPASSAPATVESDAPAAPSDDATQPDAVGTAATTSDQVDAPAAPTTAQIAVTIGEGNVPSDVELDATLTGDGGTFSAHVRTPGAISFADVPAGDYQLRWSWVSDDGTAQAVGRLPVHVEPGDLALSL